MNMNEYKVYVNLNENQPTTLSWPIFVDTINIKTIKVYLGLVIALLKKIQLSLTSYKNKK